ncbi:hypothetical protein H312_01447 [Anncaliia algerae PRA339]|uniref:PH domain-containing protein n=1 Tax=Anncaliia algerae PRA339 TaxID=1288291 RepID=A0A059F1V3_9MICR|nr:hypothetical protein H312_01447 [Anncaliia algerae PRA339]
MRLIWETMVKKYPETQESLKEFSYQKPTDLKGKSFLSEPSSGYGRGVLEKYDEIDFIEELLSQDIKKHMSESGIKFRSRINLENYEPGEIKHSRSLVILKEENNEKVSNQTAPHFKYLDRNEISITMEHPGDISKHEISERESTKEKPFEEENSIIEEENNKTNKIQEKSIISEEKIKENNGEVESNKILENNLADEEEYSNSHSIKYEENESNLKQSSLNVPSFNVINENSQSDKTNHNTIDKEEKNASVINYSFLLKDRDKKGENMHLKLQEKEEISPKKYILSDKSHINSSKVLEEQNLSDVSFGNAAYKKEVREFGVKDGPRISNIRDYKITCPVYKFNIITDNFKQKQPQKVMIESQVNEEEVSKSDSLFDYENKKRQNDLYEEINEKLLEKKRQVTDEQDLENKSKKFYLENQIPIAFIDDPLRLNDLRHCILYGMLQIKEGNNDAQTYWFELKSNMFTCFQDKETKITTFIVPNELNGDVIHPKKKDVFLSKKFQINVYESKVFLVKNRVKWAYFFKCPFFTREDFPELIDITDKRIIRYVKHKNIFELEIQTESRPILVKVPTLEFALENNGNYVFFKLQSPEVLLKWLTAISYKQGRQGFEIR